MLERIYLDNILTFENFEWRPGPLAILLGESGSGKTGLFDVFRRIRDFLRDEGSTREIFGAATRTRWSRRREQTVEIDVRGDGGLYRYQLKLTHQDDEPTTYVSSERLHFDEVLLVEFVVGDLHLFGDDGRPGHSFRARATRSGVGAVEPGKDNRRLSWFKSWIADIWVVRPDPRAMEHRVDPAETELLAEDLKNFGAWYLKELQSRPGAMFKAASALGGVLEGFLELHERGGHVYARFGDDSASSSFRFDELSDGQRALIALYVLRYRIAGPGMSFLCDEPDNYVALREVQPWLLEVMDLALRQSGPQVWLISHHPEVLDLLAAEYGWRFFRSVNGPTRVERFAPAAGLGAAETVARGWEDDAQGG